jgi:hypothetical protein
MTKNNTLATLDEELAAAQAEADRLRAQKERIGKAEADARRAAELEYYREAAGARAHTYRDARDEAKNRLDALAAGAETIDLNELFTAFLEFKELDARAGSLESHASRINYVAPLGRNSRGVDQSHVIACAQLHERLSWSDYVNWVVTERTKRARAQHAAELEDGAYKKISAAGEQARAAAAANG